MLATKQNALFLTVCSLPLLCASTGLAQFRDLYNKAKQEVQQSVQRTARATGNTSAGRGGNYDFCALQFGSRRYYSSIFVLPAARDGSESVVTQEEPARFKAYVLQTFPEHAAESRDRGGCGGGWPTEAEAKEAKDQDQRHFNEEHMLNAKTIETDWKWSNVTVSEQQAQLPVPEGGSRAEQAGIAEPTPSASTQHSPAPGSSELSAALEKEHEKAPAFCHSQIFLGAYYDCNCFSDKLLEARQQNGSRYERAAGTYVIEPQLGQLAEELDLRSCVAPDKIRAYTAKQKMNGYYGMSDERKRDIIGCAAQRMVDHLTRDPHGQRVIDNYDKQDSADCALGR